MNDKNGNIPDLNVVKGILAIIFGAIFIGLAYRIILSIILFVTGLMLIYYGLAILNVKKVTECIDQVIAQVKRLMRG